MTNIFKFAVISAIVASALSLPAGADTLTREVTVYYDSAGGLKAEIRQIAKEEFAEGEIKSVIDQLIKGSQTYTRTLPESTRINKVFIDAKRIVYLDFNEEFIKDHPAGVAAEMLTVASICRSIFTNFDVNGVRILSGGGEIKTLAGHIDLESPVTRFDIQEWLTVRKR